MRLPIRYALSLSGCEGLRHVPSVTSKHYSIMPLWAALEKKDFPAIIESKELFWLAFCHAYDETANKLFNVEADSFDIRFHRDVTVSGKDDIIESIQRFVEEIRILFIKGHIKQGGFQIVPIEICTDYVLKEHTEVIDLKYFYDFDSVNNNYIRLGIFFYENFVEASLPKLFELLGAICIETRIMQKILTFREETINVKAFKIEWPNGDHFVYPIKISIPSHDEFKSQ